MTTPRRIDWPAGAAQLAAALPPARLHPAALAWAATSPPRTKWAVAFSGGADSLALLLLLWAHFPSRRKQLVALHLNHRLRGRASDADEKFCVKVCAALGMKLVCGTWDDAPRGASEADAREARLDFFARHARVFWLGHQQDDIAEMLLMRLARGSGAGGLGAPRPVQPRPRGRVHLRPLLTLKKAELIAALEAAGLPWREDATNAKGDFFRNRIRRDVLPAWRAAAPERDALAGAALTRELLADDDAALETWLDELQPLAADGALDLRRLAGKPRGLVRRALRRWLSARRGTAGLSRQGFETLLAAVLRGRPTRQSLGAHGFAIIRRERLFYQKGK